MTSTGLDFVTTVREEAEYKRYLLNAKLKRQQHLASLSPQQKQGELITLLNKTKLFDHVDFLEAAANIKNADDFKVLYAKFNARQDLDIENRDDLTALIFLLMDAKSHKDTLIQDIKTGTVVAASPRNAVQVSQNLTQALTLDGNIPIHTAATKQLKINNFIATLSAKFGINAYTSKKVKRPDFDFPIQVRELGNNRVLLAGKTFTDYKGHTTVLSEHADQAIGVYSVKSSRPNDIYFLFSQEYVAEVGYADFYKVALAQFALADKKTASKVQYLSDYMDQKTGVSRHEIIPVLAAAALEINPNVDLDKIVVGFPQCQLVDASMCDALFVK